jgi:hypothetical protein
MATQKPQPKKAWLDEGIRHLETLCKEASQYAGEGDVLPTQKGFISAVQVLQTFHRARAPKMGLTVNGEIELTWEDIGDKSRVYVRPDGSVQFFRNKVQVDEHNFSKYLTATEEHRDQAMDELVDLTEEIGGYSTGMKAEGKP